MYSNSIESNDAAGETYVFTTDRRNGEASGAFLFYKQKWVSASEMVQKEEEGKANGKNVAPEKRKTKVLLW